ncbi:hypothetical protein [Nocardia sp. NPDC057353]|uniref:hypothetical protein n=1 Tax=Nocardia sp. NPDC057353 TaxID=3346104 RepID=UPI003632388E
MFSAAAVIPAPPVLVPELCGGAAESGAPDPARAVEQLPGGATGDARGVGAGLRGAGAGDPRTVLRAAVLDVLAALAAEGGSWTVLGTGQGQYGPDTVGTFLGYGVDLAVALGPAASSEPDPELELPVLIAGWARGAVAPATNVEVRLLPEETPAREAAAFGARLRAELDAGPEPRGVLVIADGAATLTTAAPGYLDERAPAVQRALDTALATGDRAALLELDPALCAELVLRGRAVYQALAGLFGRDGAVAADTRYQDAPFGVGYHAGLWRPA